MDRISEEIESDLFHEVAKEIENEWDLGGLSNTIYEKYARACYNRYMEKIENDETD